MECATRIRHIGARGKVREHDGKVIVDDRSIILLGQDGDEAVIPFEDVRKVSDLDAVIGISLIDGDLIEITKTGDNHSALKRILMKGRNSIMLRDRLIDERTVLKSFRCSFELKAGPSVMKGTGEASLYERSFIFSPDDGQLFRIWLVKINRVEKTQDRLLLHHHLGTMELFDISIGLDALDDTVRRILLFLRNETEVLLKEMHPQLSVGASEKVAEALMDGRAALKREITVIDPNFWTVLEDRLNGSNLGSKFKFLSSTSKGHSRIGVMKEERTGKVCLWYLAPMKLSDMGDFKIIAYDSQIDEGSGATLMFSFDNMAEFIGHDDETAVIEALAESLRSAGFRSDVIFMSEYELRMPENSRYLKAINAMPELAALRDAYIGRAEHDDMWASTVRTTIRIMEENEGDR